MPPRQLETKNRIIKTPVVFPSNLAKMHALAAPRGSPQALKKPTGRSWRAPGTPKARKNTMFYLLSNIISAHGALPFKNRLFLKTIKIPQEYMYYCVPCHHALSPGVAEFGVQAPPLDPPMSCTLPQGHPRDLPRAKHTLPKAPGRAPQGP